MHLCEQKYPFSKFLKLKKGNQKPPKQNIKKKRTGSHDIYFRSCLVARILKLSTKRLKMVSSLCV